MGKATSVLRTTLEKIARVGRGASDEASLTEKQRQKLIHLREQGYVMFDHLVGTEPLKRIQSDYRKRIEIDQDFEFPVLAQSKVDPVQHADLVSSNFLATNEVLRKRGVTFDRADVRNYDQAIAEFAPSTLTTSIPNDKDWFDVWLDADVLPVVDAYMGFTPHLVEAFVRRNFPSRFVVMNHAWHRDSNHDTHLLKAFIFLTDCTLKSGPHHFIAGSVQDRRIDGKHYFSDAEVRKVYPPESGREIISIVPAGTIILEDTRGLHKAGIPEEGYRDLGYCTFVPPISLVNRASHFTVGRATYESLSPMQRRYIPATNIC